MAVGKGRTVAIVRGAVAFHLDDDVLRVGFGFARDGERSDARHGVFLGKADVHQICPPRSRKMRTTWSLIPRLSTSALVMPASWLSGIRRSNCSKASAV